MHNTRTTPAQTEPSLTHHQLTPHSTNNIHELMHPHTHHFHSSIATHPHYPIHTPTAPHPHDSFTFACQEHSQVFGPFHPLCSDTFPQHENFPSIGSRSAETMKHKNSNSATTFEMVDVRPLEGLVPVWNLEPRCSTVVGNEDQGLSHCPGVSPHDCEGSNKPIQLFR